MENHINKLLEYNDIANEVEYNVKASIMSAPEDIEINNIDIEENKGFVFNILLTTIPLIPNEIINTTNEIIFIFGRNEMNQFGYLVNQNIEEIEENSFVSRLKVHILEVLMLGDNEGHYKI